MKILLTGFAVAPFLGFLSGPDVIIITTVLIVLLLAVFALVFFVVRAVSARGRINDYQRARNTQNALLAEIVKELKKMNGRNGA